MEGKDANELSIAPTYFEGENEELKMKEVKMKNI